MKKNTLTIAIILIVINISCLTVFACGVDDISLRKEIPFNFSGQLIGNFDVIVSRGIDYISLKDLVLLFQLYYSKQDVEYNDKMKKNGIITYEIEDGDNKLQWKFDFLNNTIYAQSRELLKLDNLAINLLIYKDNYFVPICVVGFLTEHRVQLYNAGDRYLGATQSSLLNEVNHNKCSDLENQSQDGILTRELKKTSFLYLLDLCSRYYPGLEKKKINLAKIKESFLTKIINTEENKEFYNLLYKTIYSFNDLHMDIASLGYRVQGSVDVTIRASQYFNALGEVISEPNTKVCFKTLPNGIGYIYIPTFDLDSNTFINDLNTAVKEFKDKKTVIIDIRGNNGGYAINANYLLGFLVEDKFKVYNEGDGTELYNDPFRLSYYVKIQHGGVISRVTTHEFEKQNYLAGKLILLTDKRSYSASNYVSSVFRQEKMGVIIGEKTNGGGYVPWIYILPDNTIIRLPATVTNTDENGNDFENGVEPDILVKNQKVNNSDMILETAINYAINNYGSGLTN